MKLIKYLLLTIGILGLIASIYNMIYTHSISDQKTGLLAGIFLIFVSFNLNKITKGFKNFKFTNS